MTGPRNKFALGGKKCVTAQSTREPEDFKTVAGGDRHSVWARRDPPSAGRFKSQAAPG